MSTDSNRKIAVVLFADIVGYTALMQSNESTALSLLQKFKFTLESEVSQYNGKIANFYGDGCLAVFNSSIDATNAAKSLQSKFQSELIVPVRLGLHAGDVVFEEGNVFGDAVNIASRIESMGVAGSILMSKTVRDQIKNKEGFEVSLLGNFDFKNVNETIPVYALIGEGLVLPDNDNLLGKGKLKLPNPKQSNTTFYKIGLLVLFLVLGGYLISKKYFFTQSPTSELNDSTKLKSVAVLPFKNWSGNSELDYFVDGMTDEVITRLTKINAIDKVPSRTSVFQFKDSRKTLSEIAQELDVNYVLEGSFRKVDDLIKISLNLIDVFSDNSLWNDEMSGEWKTNEVFEIQSEVAENVARNLDVKITNEELASIEKFPTDNNEAYNSFLQGEFQKNKGSHEGFLKAIPLYEKVISLDSTYIQAYLSLSNLYSLAGLVWGTMDEQNAWVKAKGLLQKAHHIDKDNEQVDQFLYSGLYYYEWNFEEVEKYFQKRLNFDMKVDAFADVAADYAIKTGRYQEAISLNEKTIESNPSMAVVYLAKAQALFFQGKKEEALGLLDIYNPIYQDNHWYLREVVKLHTISDDYEKFKYYYQLLKDNFEDRAPIHIWFDVFYNFHEKEKEKVEQNLNELQVKYNKKVSGSPAWFLAMSYCVMNNEEKAMEWLQNSYDRHEVEMTWLREEPLLKPYHNHPLYKSLYEKMGWDKIGK